MIGDTIYQCTCGSREFLEVYQIRKWSGGGQGRNVKGYKCVECGAKMDGSGMSKMEKKRRAQEKLREAQALMKEIGEDGSEEDLETTLGGNNFVDG